MIHVCDMTWEQWVDAVESELGWRMGSAEAAGFSWLFEQGIGPKTSAAVIKGEDRDLDAEGCEL